MNVKTIKDTWEVRLLRTLVWIYIVLCILIAGFNYGYAPSAPESVRRFINLFWLFYENWIKTSLIVGCGYLTLRIVGKGHRTTMRRRNIIGMTIAALFIHILIPLVSGNWETYYYGMPLPWSNVPLQSMVPSADFTQRHILLWGAQGITFALTVFWIINVIVLIGTLIYGRRWQCSTLCLFNGFAVEVFSPALPLLSKKRTKRIKGPLRLTMKEVRRFSVIRILFFIISISLTIFWFAMIRGVPDRSLMGLFEQVELYKYLVFELLMMMFFWVAFIGRGYCLYCPVGTVVASLGKLVGQRIETNMTKCIGCRLCSKVCPVGIDVAAYAQKGIPMDSTRCVACGHCIDACPTETLRYTTDTMELIARMRKRT